MILEQTYKEDTYYTYIYVYENELKELFLKDGTNVPARTGRTLLAVERFSMDVVKDGLFRFSCTDTTGSRDTVIVGMRSGR